MILMIVGGGLIIAGIGWDMFFRNRLEKLGDKMAIVRGAFFDFRQYHRVRAKLGWAAWPVYVM